MNTAYAYDKSTSSDTPGAAVRRKQLLRRNLRASLGDGMAFGGMVGIGETFLPAFVLAVGLGELTAGLVASVPMLAGGIVQLVAPKAIQLTGSHKQWVVLAASVQAFSFVPLVLAACWGQISALAVFCVAAVYWGAGLATGPAWNTWIEGIVPRRVRPRYFAVRTRASQAAVCAGFLLGGVSLQAAAGGDYLLWAFAGLFAAAGVCRLASVWMLSRQSESPHTAATLIEPMTWRENMREMATGSSGRLLLYLVAVQGAVQMAGPYFTPFMLKQLHFTYFQYVSLISAAFVAKVMMLPFCGHAAHRLGARRLLWIGGVGIVPLSASWLVSQDFYWLVTVQILGGAAWASYELAFFLLFFESIPAPRRTSVLTLYNLLNTAAFMGGALVGGWMLSTTGASFHGYLLIFGISSVGRLAALGLLATTVTRSVPAAGMAFRTLAVRPNSAALDAPVLPSLPDQLEPAGTPPAVHAT